MRPARRRPRVRLRRARAAYIVFLTWKCCRVHSPIHVLSPTSKGYYISARIATDTTSKTTRTFTNTHSIFRRSATNASRRIHASAHIFRTACKRYLCVSRCKLLIRNYTTYNCVIKSA